MLQYMILFVSSSSYQPNGKGMDWREGHLGGCPESRVTERKGQIRWWYSGYCVLAIVLLTEPAVSNKVCKINTQSRMSICGSIQ